MCFNIKISSNMSKSKNSPFLAMFGDTLQKVAANRTISKLDALPIAHFEADVPDFSKHLLTLAIPLTFWVPAYSEVSSSRTMTAKMNVFRPHFGRKLSF